MTSTQEPARNTPDAAKVEDPRLAFAAFHSVIARYERSNAIWRRQLGINANERLAITHLIASGALTAADLSKRIGMTSAAVTTLIDRLEASGLVKRVPDSKDRRCILLYPTRKGLVDVGALVEPVASEIQKLFEEMSSCDQLAVLSFLTAAGEVFEQHATPT